MQGLGGAIVSAVAFSLIMFLFTEPVDRAKAMGVFGFVMAGGGSIGVLLGGISTGSLDWHWIFLVNLPIGVDVVFALSLQLLPKAHASSGEQRLDVVGAITVTTALVLAVYAIVNGNQAGWTSAQTLGLLAVSAALLLFFLWRESPGSRSTGAARALQAPECRDGQRRRCPLGRCDVRVVLPLGALPPTRPRLYGPPGRPGLPARQSDHGSVLARTVGEARAALWVSAASGDGTRAGFRRGFCYSRALRSTGPFWSTSCRA